jgi:hypothetical protein
VGSREITIRRVDPTAGREQILAVLARNLPSAAVAERLDWLYLSNPDGPALVWLAEDADGNAIGTSAAHPRRMRVHGTGVRALLLGDFAIDRAYRTLGPGLRLLRATLDPVRQAEYAFSYDFPSRSMRAIYDRVRGIDLGGMERWMRPAALTWRPRRLLSAAVRGGVALMGAGGSRSRDTLTRGLDLDVEPLVGEFGEEFDILDGRLGALRPVLGVRDAAYLNWRYRKHTMWRHDVLCARRHGSLVGYAILRSVTRGSVTLMDLYADADPVGERLAAEAVEWARSRDAEALYVEVLSRSGTARMARALGFTGQDGGVGPLTFFPVESAYATTLEGADNWWLMGGDRDI